MYPLLGGDIYCARCWLGIFSAPVIGRGYLVHPLLAGDIYCARCWPGIFSVPVIGRGYLVYPLLAILTLSCLGAASCQLLPF